MFNFVFCGTTFFAAEILQKLLNHGYQPLLVVTQPDKAKDRQQKQIYSPVKLLAKENNLTLAQPEKIKELVPIFQNYQQTAMIVVAYGQIIPNCVLDQFSLLAWNIHASDLPNFRGGSPIQTAIKHQCTTSGVTIIKMIQKLDAGPILLQKIISLSANATYKSLSKDLIEISKELILEAIPLIQTKNFKLITQDESKITFAPNISKEKHYINWNQKATIIVAHINAFNDVPVAKTKFQEQLIKIFSADVIKKIHNFAPGTIISLNKKGILVAATKNSAVLITEIQWQNKKQMSVATWINGQRILQVGDKFTD